MDIFGIFPNLVNFYAFGGSSFGAHLVFWVSNDIYLLYKIYYTDFCWCLECTPRNVRQNYYFWIFFVHKYGLFGHLETFNVVHTPDTS